MAMAALKRWLVYNSPGFYLQYVTDIILLNFECDCL